MRLNSFGMYVNFDLLKTCLIYLKLCGACVHFILNLYMNFTVIFLFLIYGLFCMF
jgi:hypothetical protein